VSHPISLRDFPWFFVLVLRVSSTRSRTRRCGNEYDYEFHFIKYEYGAEPRVRNFKNQLQGWHGPVAIRLCAKPKAHRHENTGTRSTLVAWMPTCLGAFHGRLLPIQRVNPDPQLAGSYGIRNDLGFWMQVDFDASCHRKPPVAFKPNLLGSDHVLFGLAQSLHEERIDRSDHFSKSVLKCHATR
jgi:hypothetical protein